MRSILDSKSRKAQEMSVATIIIIIIAIVVLVFLIVAFTRGGGSLMDNIRNFFGGSSNVDTIKNACTAACATNQAYEYNKVPRDVRFDKDTKVTGVTCRDLESAKVGGCYNNATLIVDVSQDNCKGVWSTETTGVDGTIVPSGCTVNGVAQTGLDSAQCNAIKWVPGYSKVLDSPCTNILASA